MQMLVNDDLCSSCHKFVTNTARERSWVNILADEIDDGATVLMLPDHHHVRLGRVDMSLRDPDKRHTVHWRFSAFPRAVYRLDMRSL